MNKIILLVPSSNKYWPVLQQSMHSLANNFVENKDNKQAPTKEESFILNAKSILKEEWDEIQDVIYSRKLNNA